MASLAFDECHAIRTREARLAVGSPNHPSSAEIRKAEILEDISLFIEAVRALDAKAKASIVKQIADNAQRKADARSMNRPNDDRQGKDGE